MMKSKRFVSITENPAIQGSMPFVDITAPLHGVEIQIASDDKVIWIHVDGQTVLRICRIPKLERT